MAAPVLAGTHDLLLGRRRPTARAAWPLHGRAGNALLAWRLRYRCGIAVHDPGAMRAARRTRPSSRATWAWPPGPPGGPGTASPWR